MYPVMVQFWFTAFENLNDKALQSELKNDKIQLSSLVGYYNPFDCSYCVIGKEDK